MGCRSSVNKRLIQMVNNLAERIYRYRLECIKDKSNHAKLIDEHEMIMKYVLAGDADKACEYAEMHIENQEKSVLSQISEA